MCEQDQTAGIQPGPHFMGKLRSEENKHRARGVCIIGSYPSPALCRTFWAPKTSFSKFLINFPLGKIQSVHFCLFIYF